MKPKPNLLVTAFLLFTVVRVPAATLPPGFSETAVASGLNVPTAMEFAPDGRLFVCQQGGSLRVIKNNTLLGTPFLSLTTDSSGERGLLGVTFDPDFHNNQWVYVYYTVPGSPAHNRVSRFTASADVAVPGSEHPILELDDLSSATNHNGGAIHFGPDGKLYIAVGENANPANAQMLANRLGKMLRLNSNGSIPTDNPFYGVAVGVNQAIWSLGLRNPFTFAFQPGTGRMLINDVGQSTWEEIDEGIRGANYGWPNCEGVCNPSQPTSSDPIYQYSHSEGCAIAGGAFYNPPVSQFPSAYAGVYFFADLCDGWIRWLDPDNGNQVSTFATGLINPVDLKVSGDGALYYLDRGQGAVFRVQFTGTTALVTLTLQTDPPGLDLIFDGQRVSTPFSTQSGVGATRTLSAPTSAKLNRINYRFASWSDGGAQTHAIVTPAADATYTATYQAKGRR